MTPKLSMIWLLDWLGRDLYDEYRDRINCMVILAHGTRAADQQHHPQPGPLDAAGLERQFRQARERGLRVRMVCGPGGAEDDQAEREQWWRFVAPFVRGNLDLIDMLEPLHEHNWTLAATRAEYRRFAELVGVPYAAIASKLVVSWGWWGGVMPDPAFSPEFIVMFEAYDPNPAGSADSPAIIRRRLEAFLASMPSNSRLSVAVQCFGRNGLWAAGEDALIECSRVPLEYAINDPRIIAWEAFAAQRQPHADAMIDIPRLADSTREFRRRTNVAPPPPPPPGEGELSQQERDEYERRIAELRRLLAVTAAEATMLHGNLTEIRTAIDGVVEDMLALLPDTPVKPRLRKRYRKLAQRLDGIGDE